MMRRYVLFAIIFLAFVLKSVQAAFPENLGWILPAEYRYIYEVNTAPLDVNSYQDVYVEINIPVEAYGSYWQHQDDNSLCIFLEKNATEELMPKFYYVSTSLAKQRFITDWSMEESYVLDLRTACENNDAILYLPKRVLLHLQSLDGGTSFKDYNHYILAYFPNYNFRVISFTYNPNAVLYKSGGWTWINSSYGATPNAMKACSTPGVLILPVSIQIDENSMYIYFLNGTASVTPEISHICLRLITRDGKKVNISFNGQKCENYNSTYFGGADESYVIGYTPALVRTSLLSPIISLVTSRPISDFKYIDKIMITYEGGTYSPCTTYSTVALGVT